MKFAQKNKNEFRAFTLAETLITLVIIGIVAALTIPNLIIKYQKEQTVIKLKKAYSALAQTTNRAIADNGPVETWEYTSKIDFAQKYLIPYLNISTNCINDNTAKCQYSYKQRNGNSVSVGNSSAKFYLGDGTFVFITGVENSSVYKTATVMFSIDGKKKNNLIGKNIFEFRYILTHPDYTKYKGKLIPNCYGLGRNFFLNSGTYGCAKGNGTCCTALIVGDGWKISDDYPW